MLVCPKCGEKWVPSSMFCPQCRAMGIPVKEPKGKNFNEIDFKDEQMSKLIKKFNDLGFSVISTNKRSNIFDINGKLVNIKYDRLKNDRYSFWFDTSFKDLNDLDLFIYICNIFPMSYVIPCRILSDILTNRASVGKDKQSYNFTIYPYEDLLMLNKHNKIDIKNYYNNYDLLR